MKSLPALQTRLADRPWQKHTQVSEKSDLRCQTPDYNNLKMKKISANNLQIK